MSEEKCCLRLLGNNMWQLETSILRYKKCVMGGACNMNEKFCLQKLSVLRNVEADMWIALQRILKYYVLRK
jgi:hypothetical protein